MIFSIANRILRLTLPPGVMGRNIWEDLQQELQDLQDQNPGLSFSGWYLSEAIKLGFYFNLFRVRSLLGRRQESGGGDGRSPLKPGDPPWRWVGQDLKIAVRRLRRNPSFTLVAVLTLALGIGATTAIFTVVNGVLLRPLPYSDPHRLVSLWTTDQRWRESENARLREVWDKVGTAYPTYLEWEEENRVFDHLGAYHGGDQVLIEGDFPERIVGSSATAGVFEVLEVAPFLGRTIQPLDDRMGAERVAVLSYGLWQRRFSADRQIIGRTIRFEDESLKVVGVMPRSFYFPGPEVEIWTNFDDETRGVGRGLRFLKVIGRLRDGVTPDQSESDMARVNDQIRVANPGDHVHFGTRLIPRLEEVVGEVRTALLLFLGAVGLVLLIASANVTSLLLTRGTERKGELAICAALGAGGSRLAGQILSEAMVLAGLGGALGLVVGWGAVDPLVALLPTDTPRAAEISMDLPVLAFSGTMTLLSVVLIGALPAIRSAGTQISGTLKGSSRGATGTRRTRKIRSALVAGQIALTFILLASSAVLLKSLDGLTSVNKGFSSEDVLVMELRPPAARYADGDAVSSFYGTLVEELKKVPGVTAVAGSYSPPFTGNSWQAGATLGGSESEEQLSIGADLVFGPFFEVMDIPLLSGRTLNSGDSRDHQGAAVVNEAMARRYWPGEDPIGQVIVEAERRVTVVGIVANVKQLGFDDEDRPLFYMPLTQSTRTHRHMYVFVKTGIGLSAVAPAVRAALWELDRSIPIRSMAALEELVARSVAAPRSRAILMSAFAWLAMLLAVVGVYGITSYAVSRRTQELSVRMALGAQRPSVLGIVLWEALTLVGVGLATGLMGALFLFRLLEPFLFQMAALDLSVMGQTALALAGTTVLASFIPARRATLVDPAQALKER